MFEDIGSVNIPLSLPQQVAVPVTVDFQIMSGSAMEGLDKGQYNSTCSTRIHVHAHLIIMSRFQSITDRCVPLWFPCPQQIDTHISNKLSLMYIFLG